MINLFELISKDTTYPIQKFLIDDAQVMISVLMELRLMKSEGNYLLNFLRFSDLHLEDIHKFKYVLLMTHQLIFPLALNDAFGDIRIDT